MWSFNRVPGNGPTDFAYTITSLSSKSNLINSGASVTLGGQGSTWSLVPVGSLYAIVNVTASKQRVVLGRKISITPPTTVSLYSADDIAADVKGEIGYLWDLTREGTILASVSLRFLCSSD